MNIPSTAKLTFTDMVFEKLQEAGYDVKKQYFNVSENRCFRGTHFNYYCSQVATYEENSDGSSFSASFVSNEIDFNFDFIRVSVTRLEIGTLADAFPPSRVLNTLSCGTQKAQMVQKLEETSPSLKVSCV